MKTRTVELLQKFRKHPYPIKAEQLASAYRVSKRTIRQDILEANSWLREQEFSEIQSIRNKGFLLCLTEKEKQGLKIKLASFNGEILSREVRIFALVLAIAYDDEPVFLKQKEAIFMVSKSTMDEDIRRVRAAVKNYGIEIVSYGKQGLVYKGVERSIRTMLYDLTNQYLGRIDFSFTDVSTMTPPQKLFYRYFSVDDIKKIEKIYSNKITREEDEIYRNQLLLFILIWIQRVRKHEWLSVLTEESVEKEDTNFSEFTEQIRRAFQLEEMPQVERNYLRLMVDLFHSRDISNSVEWVQAQLLTIQLIQFVEKETMIPFHLKEELLFEHLYKHMTALIVRIKNKVQVMNPLKENIRLTYGTIYQAVARFMPLIEKVVAETVMDDEIAFLVIHFSTIASAIRQNASYKYRSVVVCNHGVATGNLLAENLKEKFPQIEVLAVLSSKEVTLVDKLEVDLIFSTFHFSYEGKPLLVIEPILTEENHSIVTEFLKAQRNVQRVCTETKELTNLFTDVLTIVEESGGTIDQRIYANLENLFEKNGLEINKREIQPMLKDRLTDNHILIQEEPKTWQETIELVAKPLIKENIVEPRYVDAMIHAVEEYGAYIVIGKHLALAHARPEDGVNQLGVSVTTLKQPIDFGNQEMDPVKIVFCLAAADSYSHLTIMKELIELINNEEKLAQLMECRTIETFKTLLFQ